MATIVLTALGDDQTGLVDALAGTISEHGGNWERSHMAQLAGKFAGIVVASVPDARVDGLVAALEPLEAQGLLDLTIERADDGASTAAPGATFSVELVGQDRLGIIHDLASSLAGIGASIDELTTQTSDAPMAGGQLFEAQATVTGPSTLTADAVEDAVADLGRDFQLDVKAG